MAGDVVWLKLLAMCDVDKHGPCSTNMKLPDSNDVNSSARCVIILRAPRSIESWTNTMEIRIKSTCQVYSKAAPLPSTWDKMTTSDKIPIFDYNSSTRKFLEQSAMELTVRTDDN